MIIKEMSLKDINTSMLIMAGRKGKRAIPTRSLALDNINASLKAFGDYEIKDVTVKAYNEVVTNIEREVANVK